MDGVLKAMLLTKLKIGAALVAVGLLLGGAGLAAFQSAPAQPARQAPLPPPEVQPQQQTARLDQHGDPLPAGAVARLGSDRWLHGEIAAAGFLPDGKTVVTAAYGDATIRFWEFPSGKEIRRITVPFATAAAALSKDGKMIALCDAGGDDDRAGIYVHDLASGQELKKLTWTLQKRKNGGAGFPRLPGVVAALAFSPNGEHLALYENHDTVRLWDWAKDKQIQSFTSGVDRSIFGRSYSITYSPDGKSIAVRTNSGGKWWDTTTGKEIRSIGEDSSKIAAFSPDGKTLAVIGYEKGDKYFIRLVDAATGKEKGKTDERLQGIGWNRIVFGKGGTKVYAGYEDYEKEESRVGEWDVATGKLLRSALLPLISFYDSLNHLSLSPDGTMLLGHGNYGPFCLDISGKDISVRAGPAQGFGGLRFLPDGKQLLISRRGSVERWNTVTEKNLGPISLPGSKYLDLRGFSRDGKFAAQIRGGSKDVPVKIVVTDVASGKDLGQITPKTPEWPRFMRFSPHGKILALQQTGALDKGTQATDGKIELYEVPGGALLNSINIGKTLYWHRHILRNSSAETGPLIFSPDGKTLAAWADENAFGFWDTMTGRRIGSLPRPQTPRKLSRKDVVNYPSATESALFSPDGRCLALEMADGTTALYELASTAQLRHTFGKPQPRRAEGERGPYPVVPFLPCYCFAFSPDGQWLAQADGDCVVHVWDILTGKELAAFKGHTLPVKDVAFAPDGKTLASASSDSTALLWDVSKLGRPAPPARALQPGDLEKGWQALADDDAQAAWAKMADLVAASNQTVLFLQDRVKPAVAIGGKSVEELIRQVDNEQFKVRARAIDELLKIGDPLMPALNKALAANPPLETRRRLEDLRSKLTGLVLQGERLRASRAVEVLELIGTPQARAVLQALADGAPGALVTVNAQAALKR
jgi:WD40 repeat protein